VKGPLATAGFFVGALRLRCAVTLRRVDHLESNMNHFDRRRAKSLLLVATMLVAGALVGLVGCGKAAVEPDTAAARTTVDKEKTDAIEAAKKQKAAASSESKVPDVDPLKSGY
jgi:hypothetical protein